LFEKAGQALREAVQHPATKGISLDDPEMIVLRREILEEKPFLRKIYQDWYERLREGLIEPGGCTLELGSGAGFLQEYVPGLITSDVIFVRGLSAVLRAEALPVKTGGLDAVMMCNVLHHVPDVERFFYEATRCIRQGGRLLMIEPWVTPWSRFIYRYLHHEPFDPEAADWGVAQGGHLSGANGALPWMIFERDRKTFRSKFPGWHIERIDPFMPFTYLLSGGFTSRTLLPGWCYIPLRWLERILSPRIRATAMFAYIQLLRV
jgi:SAM-dependent methyltransferase